MAARGCGGERRGKQALAVVFFEHLGKYRNTMEYFFIILWLLFLCLKGKKRKKQSNLFVVSSGVGIKIPRGIRKTCRSGAQGHGLVVELAVLD